MACSVAAGAQSDQVAFIVLASAATMLEVVDLEINPTTTGLAPPAIAFQHRPVQLAVGISVQP